MKATAYFMIKKKKKDGNNRIFAMFDVSQTIKVLECLNFSYAKEERAKVQKVSDCQTVCGVILFFVLFIYTIYRHLHLAIDFETMKQKS